jgi:thymidine kinase
MAKLYFRYGTVGSAKTLTLLAIAHNYRQQGKQVLLIKPEMDTRFGRKSIKSRAGLEMPADILVGPNTKIELKGLDDVHCIIVDEAQFLSIYVIEQLRKISHENQIPVICYGSKRLMELADSIEEVKATCHFCNKKSVMNLKHVNGKAVSEGPSIELGAEEKYFPACYHCYKTQVRLAQEKDQTVLV